MASIYKRINSPFWWIKWRNPDTRQIERFATLFVHGDAREYFKAVQLRNQYSVKQTAHEPTGRNPFANWVVPFLESAHASSAGTLARYLGIWKILDVYLSTIKVTCPDQVKRAHCLEYVAWRSKVSHLNNRKARGKLVNMNTVLLEIKVLGKILQEAVNRKFIEYNPCTRLRLKRGPLRIKDEMTDEQIGIIEREVAKVKKATPMLGHFFETSFHIARLQGIRLSETHIALNHVNLDRRVLLIHGKGAKVQEVNLNPNLVDFFVAMRGQGRTHTYTPPDNPGLAWYKFFGRLRRRHPDFKNISFHSTRVTVITRMERAGVPENVMMKTVLHSSTTVHRGYRRVLPGELAPYWNSLNSKPSSADSRPAGENPDAH